MRNVSAKISDASVGDPTDQTQRVEKRCSKCSVEKPITDFYTKGKGKLQPWCKACESKRKSRGYNREKKLQAAMKKQRKHTKVIDIRTYAIAEVFVAHDGHSAEEFFNALIEGVLCSPKRN
jgi:hypothetical protein